MANPIFDAVVRTSRERLFHGAKCGDAIILMEKFAQGFPGNGRVRGETKDFGGLRAEGHDVGARVPTPISKMARGEREVKTFGGFESPFLSLFAKRDVIDNADKTVWLAALINQQRDGCERPDDGAVFANIALLNVVFLDFARKQFSDIIASARQVVRESDIQERVREKLFAIIAENFGEAIVDLFEFPIERGDGHADGSPVKSGAEMLLADLESLVAAGALD